MRRRRLGEQDCLVIFDEFMSAAFARWPKVIVQFEGFQNSWASKLLEQYGMNYRMFNDDIQGTIGVMIAGLLGAVKAQGKPMSDFSRQRIVVTGVGSDGVALLNALRRTMAMVSANEDSSERCSGQFWIVDDHGLLTEDRANIDQGTHPFSRKKSELLHGLCDGTCIADVVKIVKPDILILLSDVAGWSSHEVFEAMKESSTLRPVIFAIANSQCTAKEIFAAFGENVAYASRDQLPNVDLGNGKVGYANHINNIYLIPGLALGCLLSGVRLISDDIIFAGVKCLAAMVKEEDVLRGILYPPITSIRDVTLKVAATVLREAVERGLAEGCGAIDTTVLAKHSMEETMLYVKENMWMPSSPI